MMTGADITRIFRQTALERTLGCNEPDAAPPSLRAFEPAGRVRPPTAARPAGVLSRFLRAVFPKP